MLSPSMWDNGVSSLLYKIFDTHLRMSKMTKRDEEADLDIWHFMQLSFVPENDLHKVISRTGVYLQEWSWKVHI